MPGGQGYLPRQRPCATACMLQHPHTDMGIQVPGAHAGAPAARAPDQAPQVVVTRERGKNGKLMKALQQRGITALELPLVETAPGPDQARLPGVLSERRHDWVALTSPEAARVFLDAWQQAGRPGVGSLGVLLAVEEHGLGFRNNSLPAISLIGRCGQAAAFRPSAEPRGVVLLKGDDYAAATGRLAGQVAMRENWC